MKKIKHLFIILSVGIFSACGDYLDIVPDMIATIEDNAFSMRSQAEKFFFTCYSYLPQIGGYNEDPTLLGGDEIWTSTEYTGAANARRLALGDQRSNEPFFDFWRGTNGAKNLYRGISDCNIFIANIGRVPDMTDEERNRWTAEVEVIKAWLHFYLIRMYGPIPIKDVNLSVQDDSEATHVFRNTMDECVKYCTDKMDSVLNRNHLMIEPDQATELGRITKGVALVMKAKMLVTFASPLFNGNTDYIGLKDKRGIEIFNPTKSEEEKAQLWQRAAQACKDAIDFCDETQRNKLYRFTGTQFGNISEQTRLKLSIRGSFVERWNDDVLWADSRNWPQDLQLQAYPRDLNATLSQTQTTNRNNYAVPLKIVNQFYTKNGVPIEEDKTWDYNARFSPRTVGPDQLYYLQVGEQTAGMFFDREPRLYASVGFDRGVWFGQGSTSESELRAPHVRAGEFTQNQIGHSWNVTGMWPKKQLHWLTVCSGTTTVSYTLYPFPIFRLPDLYLMYAEALNEAYDTPEARTEAIAYIDRVRERAGLKGVAESWENFSSDPAKYQRQAGLRDIVRRETLIEFVFEGHRFWDIRRWKTAMAEYNKPVTGWKLTEKEPIDFYNETWVYTRKFTPKDYFWPIHDGEILRNSNTLQNYGW